MNKNIGELDRTKFTLGHKGTMYIQRIYPGISSEDIQKNVFAYPPCWGILDAGMTMENHKHDMPEFYIFVQGSGRMLLGDEYLDVKAGMSVNIPRNWNHEVINPESAVEPIIWVSIGLK